VDQIHEPAILFPTEERVHVAHGVGGRENPVAPLRDAIAGNSILTAQFVA
jgi:hypothetical protein